MKKVTIYLILALTMLTGCMDEPEPVFYEDDELTISRSLENKPEYSELLAALKRTQYFNILALQGNFTLFAVKNDALENYYTLLGKGSLDELTDEEVNNFVGMHIINKTITSQAFRAGRMTSPENGATLVMSFDEEGVKSAMINGVGFLEFDLPRTNGVIHVLESALTPPNKTIADIINETDEYSIFNEALVQTGVIDSLNIKSDATKNLYTVFVESNEAFAKGGISSFEDLKQKYSTSDDITDPKNGLNRYIRYHIVYGDFTILEFETRIYNTMLFYPLNIEIGDEFMINSFTEDETVKYATINLSQIDKPYWNGFIQELDSEIPIVNIVPDNVLFIGSSLAVSNEELDISKVIYADDAEAPWLSTDKEVFVYRCTEIGDYIEFLSPYLFGVDYKVYYQCASFQAGKSILGVSINNQPVGEPFINIYANVNPENDQYGLYIGKIKIALPGLQRVKIKVEGAYFYPDNNNIRIKKIYFVPDN